MQIILKSLSLILITFMLVGMTVGCSTVPAANTDTSNEASSETSNEASSETAPENDQADFSIEVTPQVLNGFSIPGQRCVFLVTVKDTTQDSPSAIAIKAEATNAEISVENDKILQEQVAEVTVIPNSGSEGETVAVTFSGSRGQITKEETITFDVIEGVDDRKDTAVELQQKFTGWLAENHPELGITDSTEWVGTMVSPQWLVVSHYLFFSEEWEMHIEWHIMVAPDDWVRIDLRKRFEEASPSYAFEISSREAEDEPIIIEVPNTIWR